MKRYGIRGRFAVVTGASSGIGKELSRFLAGEGTHLLLAAHPREERALQALAEELEENHGIETYAVSVDLASPGGPEGLFRRASEVLPRVDILVNCAGLYAHGDFHQVSLEKQKPMVEVNVTALMTLTYLFLPGMIRQGEGRILNISSVAAFQPTANEAVYAATKAFVQSFSEAIRQEVRKYGVAVSILNPQTTRTPMMENVPDLPWFRIVPLADPAEIAREGVKAIKRGKAFHVADARNYILHCLLPRISTREASAFTAYVMMRDWRGRRKAGAAGNGLRRSRGAAGG